MLEFTKVQIGVENIFVIALREFDTAEWHPAW